MTSGSQDAASDKIASGELPASRKVICWAGPGAGEPCNLCGAPIPASEIAFELQNGPRVVVLHEPCHAAWLLAASDT